MIRPARSLLAFLLACCVALPQGLAQPGFGPPKKKKPAEPENPDAPQPEEPARPDQPQPDQPRPARPDRRRPTGLPEADLVADWEKGDPDRQEPSAKATPGVWHAAKTADGLRYAWSLPAGFQAGKSYDVVVLLHPDHGNFRWGPLNHPRGPDEPRPFCEGDILVCIDAMGANARSPDSRFYQPTPENAVRFRDTILETTRQLPTRHIVLYGQGAGGTFALFFASVFPALADGVLAHGSTVAENSALKSTVPIVFMHGAKDQSTPLFKAVEGLEEYQRVGHPSVRLRVLRGFNDFVNPVRAQECVDYLHAVRAEKPDVTLEAVRRLLTPKGADGMSYRTSVWHSGAYAALDRITTGKPAYDRPPTGAQKQAAADLQAEIDAEGARHVARARELLKGQNDPSALVLDGGAWLGYLGALRDDFRGVPSVEALAAEIKLDDQLKAQRTSADELLSGWSETGGDALRFEQAVTLVPRCFLVEWLPPDLASRMKACLRKADELEIPQDLRDKHEFITLYDKGWRDGLSEYERVWRQWKLDEPAKAAPEPAPAPTP